ncbi:MAG TPA: LamG-like jellyroll fold domain-containing protein [Fibrobacteria bacterium]|nr:LamG-like jellyroll fold domain-containing protein [Fibrobacteria bacterium]
MGNLLFRNAVLCGLLSWPAMAFQQAASLDFLRAARPAVENAKLLRLEALAEADSAFAVSQSPELETITGTRLEALSRRLLVKRRLGANFSSEIYQLDLWYGKRKGHDSLYRSNARDLSHYALAAASLGRNTEAVLAELALGQNPDGSWSEKKTRAGSPSLTVLALNALRNAPVASDRDARIKRGLQWLSPGLGSRLTASRADMLFLLRVSRLLAAESAFRNEFDAIWSHVERQQLANGSIQGDVELTALAVLVHAGLPGNLELKSLALVDGTGRNQGEVLVGQSILLQSLFRARNADFSGQIRIHVTLQPNGPGAPRSVDTLLAAAMVKGAEQGFRLNLGNADSVGTYRVGGTFAYLAGSDSVKTAIPGVFLRCDPAPDFRFTADSLRIVPDSAGPGDTVSIRVHFVNTGKTVTDPFKVVCLVKGSGGSFDTLGVQIFPRAGIGMPIDFTFLSAFPAGDYQARLVLDAGGLVSESNESDNVLDRNFTVYARPDLAFKGSLIAACIPAGDSADCEASAVIANKGAASTGSFLTRLTVHAGNAQIRLQDSTQSTLAASGERSLLVRFTLPEALSETDSSYLVSLILDPLDSSKESDETNNRSQKNLDYASGTNFTLRENTEEPAPIFIVAGHAVREHFNILAQRLSAGETLPIHVVILRDAADTLFQLDTSLAFTTGNSARPLAFSWTPIDSAQAYLLKMILDPEEDIAESNEGDNLFSMTRVVTGFHSRLLAGPLRIDTAGNFSLRVQAKDFLGKPISRLDRYAFSLSKSGVRSQSFGVAPLQNAHVGENRVDIVIMDTHEPATLYRTRLLYYELMPELENEFAAKGYSVNFAFRTPYFRERNDEGAVHGDFPEGIFEGEIRNLLDETDHTYKWGPAATFLASTYPWRENSLKVIVPMFSALSQGEEYNYDDAVVPNADDSSPYHKEFADSCLNRGVHPFLLVNSWGNGELKVGQLNSITGITGGSVHFPGTKERMKSELKQFIAERIANYQLTGTVQALGYSLGNDEALAVALDPDQGAGSDSTLVLAPKETDLDVQLSLLSAETRDDSVVARLLLRNRSDHFIGEVRTRVLERKNGAVVSDFSLPQGILDAGAQKVVTVMVPMTLDTVRYVFKAFGSYRDAKPQNDADSATLVCKRCPYPDLSLYSDSLTDVQLVSLDSYQAQFHLPWHDKAGGQVDIGITDAGGQVLYHGEIASSIGFNQTSITLSNPVSLDGAVLNVKLAYVSKTDRNGQDNAKAYPLAVVNNPISAFFKNVPQIRRMQAGNESTLVELSSAIAHDVDTSLSILARNRQDPSLISLVRAAASTEIKAGTQAGREAFLDIVLKDSLEGRRYGEYRFSNAAIVSSLRLPGDAKVNGKSFKVMQISGADSGHVYPLNVKPIREGKDLKGYRIQWAMTGARFDTSATHRLYFSFDPEKRFTDVDYVGDEIYTLNNFGDLRHLRAFNDTLGAPVFLQKFAGDSLRFMRVGTGDIDEDGYDDIVYTEKNALKARFGTSGSIFGSPITLKDSWVKGLGEFYDALAISEPKLADYNGDGHLDISVCPAGYAWNQLLLGDGTGSFTPGSYGAGHIGYGSGGDVFRPLGNRQDVLVQSFGSAMGVWKFPDGLASPRYGNTDMWPSASNGATAGDFDNDGKEDLLSDYAFNLYGADPGSTEDDFTTRFEVPPTVAYWPGVGNGEFAPQLQGTEKNKIYGFIPSISGWTQIGSMDNTDFNGDGYEDCIVTEASVPYRTLAYAGRGDFTFSPPMVLGYDSVGVWGLHVAYKRIVRATGAAPSINRPSANTLTAAWNPSVIGPGEYNLEAWVHGSGADSSRIGVSPSFRILPPLEVAASIAPGQPQFQVGKEFTGSLVLADTGIAYPSSEVSARVLAIASPDTLEVFNRTGLSIGASAQLSFPLGFPVKSSQTLLILVEQAGKTDTTSYSVPVAAGQAYVKGKIDLGAYEEVELFRTGKALAFALSASNAGNGSIATRLLLVLQKSGTGDVDTLHNESVTLAAGASVSRSESHAFASAGSFRAVWLSAGPADTLTLDSKLVRITASPAPQIVRTVPKAGSLVSAGSLLDIWIDTLESLSGVSVTQDAANRTAVFRKDSLGYKLYQDTIQAFAGLSLPVSISSQDVSGHNGTTAVDDANPSTFSYLFSATPQPFVVTGVQNGRVYGTDRLISVRPDANLIRFPAVLLDGVPWAGGWVSLEGNHVLTLTGILKDGRSYTQTMAFGLDKSGPRIEVDNLSDGDVLDHTVLPIVRAFDPNGAVLTIHLDGKAWSGTNIAEGVHILLANASDSLGNASTATFAFTINLQSGKYARLNPPVSGSHFNRTVHPGIESNLDDVLATRIGRKNPATFDSTAWAGLTDTLRSDSIRDWISSLSRGDSWSHTDDTSYYGFGPNGHYFEAGTQTDSMASWAAESVGRNRGSAAAFPESLLVVSSDSGLYLFDARRKTFWMRFAVDYGSNNDNPIHRPLYNLQYDDGWLFGFWDHGFVAVSFQRDLIIGWNDSAAPNTAFKWHGISSRNSGTEPDIELLGFFSANDVGFTDMRSVKACVYNLKSTQMMQLESNQGHFHVSFSQNHNPIFTCITSDPFFNPPQAFAKGASNGKSYRVFASDGTAEVSLYSFHWNSGLQYTDYQKGSDAEYMNLAPETHLNALIKSFGTNSISVPLRSLHFLTGTYLQSTFYNGLDPDRSPPKRVLSIGPRPGLTLKADGSFNGDFWRVDDGAIRVRHGLIEADTTAADDSFERLRLTQKKSTVSDFTAEYSILNQDPSKANAFVRIAFKDTLGTERITAYVGCAADTRTPAYTVEPRTLSLGFKTNDAVSEAHSVMSTLPSVGPLSMRIKIVKSKARYGLFFWDVDKWTEAAQSTAGYVWKVPLRMEMSIFAATGNPSIAFRLDRFEETNTYYLPETVQRLEDAVSFGDKILLRTLQQDTTTRYFAFDTASKAFEPASDALKETGTRRILSLVPGMLLTQAGSQTAVRKQLAGDDIDPLDSVSAEGSHVLLSRVTSAKYGVFRDTSAFTIDKTKPVVTVSGITAGHLYNSAVTIAYAITDSHLDSGRTEVRLNGLVPAGLTVSAMGNYSFRIKALDSAGNVADTTIAFSLAPELRLTGAATPLPMYEDIPDSSLNVASLFTPSSGLTYAVASVPNLAVAITASKKLYVQPEADFSGIRDVVIQATLSGVSIEDTLRIIVRPVNDPPHLVSADTIFGVGGTPVSYQIQVGDPDDVPTYQTSGLPGYLTRSGGLISGTGPFYGSSTQFTLAMSDGDTTLNKTIYVRISDVNTPPTIAPAIEVEPHAAAQTIGLDLAAYIHDAEEPASNLTWSWSTSSHVTVTQGANKDLWNLAPAGGFHDTVTLRATLTDPGGATAYQDVLLDWTLDDGPVHTFLKSWYPFRERTGASTKDSLSAATLTLTSSSMWSADTGLTFKPVSTASSGANLTLNPARGLSFEFWLKTDSLRTDTLDILTFTRTTSPTTPAWSIRLLNQELRAYQSNTSSHSTASFSNAVSREHAWHHFVVSFEADSVALYRNGLRFGKVANPGLNASSVTVTPSLGGAGSTGGNPAGIALLRIYQNKSSAFKALHNFARTEKQDRLTHFHEAEHFNRRVGSDFPYTAIAALPSDTALATDDTPTELCLLYPSDSSYVQFNVSVVAAGSYYLFGRALGKVHDNSFWAQVDNGTPVSWHASFGNFWKTDWLKGPVAASPTALSLSSGSHTIRIHARERGTLLDWVGLSSGDDLLLPFVENPVYFQAP